MSVGQTLLSVLAVAVTRERDRQECLSHTSSDGGSLRSYFVLFCDALTEKNALGDSMLVKCSVLKSERWPVKNA